MTLNQYILVFSLILIIIDLFFRSDIPTYISYILLTSVFYRIIEMNFMVRLLFSIIFFFLLIVFHYLIWKNIVELVIDKFLSKDKLEIGIERLIGIKGTVKNISKNKMAYIRGDLYQFDSEVSLKENDEFIVAEIKDGKIIIATE